MVDRPGLQEVVDVIGDQFKSGHYNKITSVIEAAAAHSFPTELQVNYSTILELLGQQFKSV